MNFKLTNQQFSSLHGMFKLICGEDSKPQQNFEARLMQTILTGIYKQLYKKAIERKKKYTITFSDQEALAFWIFFQKQQILPDEAVYESMIIDRICGEIHQKFQTLKPIL